MNRLLALARRMPGLVAIYLAFALGYADGAYSEPVGFLFFGDYGMGNATQQRVASGMVRFCKSQPCEFVLALGDNFYPRGVQSIDDPQFSEKFEKPYASLGLVFYPVFGNHDYDGNIQAQIDYSSRSNLWAFTHPYYHFNRSDVDFFAIDTEDFSFAQMSWLNYELSRSNAIWKIVYGHRPLFSFGRHGHTYEAWTWLLPLLLWHKVDFYLAGHDHNRQIIRGAHTVYVVSGAAADPGKKIRADKSLLFANTDAGFSYLNIAGREARIIMADQDGAIEFEYVVKK